MNSESRTTDIENILNTQAWRHKKLPSLVVSQKTFKVRSKTDIEKKRKSQRILTDPYHLQGPEPEESSEERQEPQKEKNESKKPLFILATPLSVISETITAISSRSASSQVLIPSFPKRKFGDKAKEFKKHENFFCVEKINEEQILQLKLDYGRIRKKSLTKIKTKFEFSQDFRRSSLDLAQKLKINC